MCSCAIHSATASRCASVTGPCFGQTRSKSARTSARSRKSMLPPCSTRATSSSGQAAGGVDVHEPEPEVPVLEETEALRRSAPSSRNVSARTITFEPPPGTWFPPRSSAPSSSGSGKGWMSSGPPSPSTTMHCAYTQAAPVALATSSCARSLRGDQRSSSSRNASQAPRATGAPRHCATRAADGSPRCGRRRTRGSPSGLYAVSRLVVGGVVDDDDLELDVLLGERARQRVRREHAASGCASG